MDKKDCNKLIMLFSSIGVILGVYLVFRYIVPIIAPFVVAFLIAYTIEKPVMKLAKPMRGYKILASSIIVFVLTTIVAIIIGYVAYQAFIEIKSFIMNYEYYTQIANCKVCDMCEAADELLGLKQGTSIGLMNNNLDSIGVIISDKVIPVIMGNSIHTLIRTATCIGIFFIMLMSVAFISNDFYAIREWRENTMFSKEVILLSKKVGELGRVYFKVQLMIMAITAVVCTIGLYIMRNPYAVVLGLIIGMLDALPLFGTGTVLIPWAIIMVMMGNFKNGAILFTIYVITYFAREIMESKLMGHRLGIAPFTMMMIIYSGLVLYGIWGFILGPVSYVIAKELILYLKWRLERGTLNSI